jgi:hypothetical protein
MLASIFIPVLMGTIEFAWQFLAAIALDNASLQASRFGSLGRLNADGTRGGSACEADVKAAAIKAGAGILQSARLTLNPTVYGSATGVQTSTGGVSGTGSGGSFVEYRLEYRQPLLFAGNFFLFKKYVSGEITHVAVTTVMNEPYPNAANQPPC